MQDKRYTPEGMPNPTRDMCESFYNEIKRDNNSLGKQDYVPLLEREEAVFEEHSKPLYQLLNKLLEEILSEDEDEIEDMEPIDIARRFCMVGAVISNACVRRQGQSNELYNILKLGYKVK